MARDHRFDLFRLSLRKRRQIDILDKIDEQMSREQWIRHLFSRTTEFRHHGTEFVYVPLDPIQTFPYVVGKIGRPVSEIEHTAPEDGYQEYIHDAWKAAVVVCDPRESDDGQKLAIQFHMDVGKPATLAPRLLQAMEEGLEYLQFLSAVHPISNSEAFWDFVERNEGKVTRIVFELEVPNMFGSDDEFDKEMKEYRDKEKAQKVSIKLENPDGIEPNTDRVKYTANKAMSQGTGTVKAKAVGKNNTFSSQKQQESARIPVDHDNETEPLIERAASMADRILGRDED